MEARLRVMYAYMGKVEQTLIPFLWLTFHVTHNVLSCCSVAGNAFRVKSMKMLWKDFISMLIDLTLNIRSHAAAEEPLVLHTLPYFLKLFEELDYPKDRMILW